jgi:hypothetical protein
MAVTLNASTTTGLVQSADTSGSLNIQSNGTTILGLTSTGASVTGTQSVSGNLQFNSGYGSVATAYGCRAWVNFDGTTNTGGFCTIRGSGNVTTVADNGTGDYTINFTTAMPDTNYSAVGNVTAGKLLGMDTLLVGSIRIASRDVANAPSDQSNVLVAIFR